MHKNLIQEIKARFNHHESKLYLQEKYTNQLTMVAQGGLWTITPQLLGYLKTADDETILIDNYNQPIKVNRAELLETLQTQYKTVTENWLSEFNALREKR